MKEKDGERAPVGGRTDEMETPSLEVSRTLVTSLISLSSLPTALAGCDASLKCIQIHLTHFGTALNCFKLVLRSKDGNGRSTSSQHETECQTWLVDLLLLKEILNMSASPWIF